jgi:hypothetical protein
MFPLHTYLSSIAARVTQMQGKTLKIKINRSQKFSSSTTELSSPQNNASKLHKYETMFTHFLNCW